MTGARASVTTADGLVGVSIDAEDVSIDLGAKPRQMAVAAARTSFDMHNPNRGFIPRRFLKRGPAMMGGEGNAAGRRRFIAQQLRVTGRGMHRRPGKLELGGVVGETSSVGEKLGAHVGGKRPTGAAQYVPAPGLAGTKKWRRIVDDLSTVGLDKAYVFVKRFGKIYIVRARERRYRGKKFEVVGFVRRNVPLRRSIDVDAMFADLPGKVQDGYARELERLFREQSRSGRGGGRR